MAANLIQTTGERQLWVDCGRGSWWKADMLSRHQRRDMRAAKKASAEAEDFHFESLLRRVLRVRAAMAHRPRDSRIVRKPAVRMRSLRYAGASGSVVDEDRIAVFIEANESGSILQSRISTY